MEKRGHPAEATEKYSYGELLTSLPTSKVGTSLQYGPQQKNTTSQNRVFGAQSQLIPYSTTAPKAQGSLQKQGGDW